MKAFKSVLSLIILGLIIPAVWAAEEAIIEDLQTDFTVTKSKADKNTQDIKSLMGGLPALEARVTALEAALAKVSPDADLTGSTYCIFGQGTWLFAEPGVSATVTANPFSARLDFTSPTQLTATPIYDPITSLHITTLHFPFLTLVDDEDDLGAETTTYTVVGNLLTIFFTDNGESDTTSFTMTPDAQVFVSGFFERSMDGDNETWETGMIVGVQAASCD